MSSDEPIDDDYTVGELAAEARPSGQTNASVEEATAEKIKSPVLERHLHSCDAS